MYPVPLNRQANQEDQVNSTGFASIVDNVQLDNQTRDGRQISHNAVQDICSDEIDHPPNLEWVGDLEAYVNFQDNFTWSHPITRTGKLYLIYDFF